MKYYYSIEDEDGTLNYVMSESVSGFYTAAGNVIKLESHRNVSITIGSKTFQMKYGGFQNKVITYLLAQEEEIFKTMSDSERTIYMNEIYHVDDTASVIVGFFRYCRFNKIDLSEIDNIIKRQLLGTTEERLLVL